jgi:hypothetical protein
VIKLARLVRAVQTSRFQRLHVNPNKEVNMITKGLASLTVLLGFVLFSCASANAQQTTTTENSNPRVVVTDNLAKPSTPANTQSTKPTTTTTKIGNFSVNVTEGVTGQNLENGKFLTVTKWDGSKWVTKREWVPNGPVPAKPNPQ